MQHCMGRAFISYTKKPINVVVWYVILASFMQNYGRANAKVPALIVFGDSIVDPGNNNYINTVGKANFPPYGRDFDGHKATGRYSNGKIPSDLIAEALGLKELIPPYMDPSLKINDLLTGVSFTSGAAGYDPESAKLANAISLDNQLKMFKGYINKLKAAVGDNMTSTIVSQSLYLLCAGSNDITNTYFALPFRKLHYDFPSYASLMVNWSSTFVQELYDLGARRIGVISAPPCGCLPSQRTLQTCFKSHSSAAACNDLVAYSLILSCCCYTCCVRGKLRKMLNINGGMFDDFLSHLMCCCCALVQEWREVEIRGAHGHDKTKISPPPPQFMES